MAVLTDSWQQHEWRAMQCVDTAFSMATGAGEFVNFADAFIVKADQPTTSANVAISRLLKHHSARRSVIGRRFISQRFSFQVRRQKDEDRTPLSSSFCLQNSSFRKAVDHVSNQENSNP